MGDRETVTGPVARTHAGAASSGPATWPGVRLTRWMCCSGFSPPSRRTALAVVVDPPG